MHPKNKQVTTHFNNNVNTHLSDLADLVKIPSVSFPGFDHKTIDESAAFVEAVLKKTGLEKVQILKIPGTFPYVYGEHCHAPGKPTVLLYAHHDVQPPGRDAVWQSDPFVPTERDGPGGRRLYGRGAADDKAGIFVHVAAIASYLSVMKGLPLNVKVIIEGEEEIGSPHLAEFLNKHQKLMRADVMILTDTANYDSGVPALTVSLRGMVTVEVAVRALQNPIHSGLWGGLVPDPVMALSKILAGLVDESGNIAVQSILDEVPALSDADMKTFDGLSFDREQFKQQAGLVPTGEVLVHKPHPLIQLWRHPSLTVTAIQASSREQAGNIINDTAWAKVTVRVPPGMEASKVTECLTEYLKESVPWGLEISIAPKVGVDGWITHPDGKHRKVFAAARAALEEGYGARAVFAGCGATIPFVKPFTEALGDAPALLIGIEDPYTNAHGENESLLISDFKKACLSEIILFQSLANLQK